MNRLVLLLGLVLLQALPDVPGHAIIPTERPQVMDEADVDSLAPTIGAPVPVWVVRYERGLPEASERKAFARGFNDRFREREMPSERFVRRDSVWKPDAPVVCNLRLADEPGEKGAWTAHVWLDWHAPRDSTADSTARAWPGLLARVSVTVAAPEPTSALAPAQPVAPAAPHEEWLRFPAGHPVDAAYHQLAGRQVAAVVMEAVQRARGELGEDRRLRLEQTERVCPPAAR
jgi:hypothetical protein